MVAFPLRDVALLPEGNLDISRDVAAQLIASAFVDIQQISKLDNTLIPDSKAAMHRPTVVLVRGMYEEWARQAELLLERLERLQSRTGKIDGYERLMDEYGRTRAMLSISIEDMEQARRDILEGRTTPAAEVRRAVRMGTL